MARAERQQIGEQTGAPRPREGGEELHDPYGHGHSVAAWTAVGVVLVGFLVMSIAVVITETWMLVAGAVIAAVGGVLGKLLTAMGFGTKQHSGH